jgi:hypothetical protein
MDSSSHLDRRSTDLMSGTALAFVILLGIVSLFSDMTYEGARSITGPYLAVLGASATVFSCRAAHRGAVAVPGRPQA